MGRTDRSGDRGREEDRKETGAASDEEIENVPVDDDVGIAAEAGSVTPNQEKGWSLETTLLLIEIFRELQHGFSDSTKKKYEVWRDIAKALQEHGYDVDGAACDKKMRTLKRRYEVIKDNANLSGRGAEKQWQYFTAMDNLMAKDPCITPPALATCFPVASTSSIQEVQPAVQVSIEPPVCVSPNSATSSTCSLYISPTDTPVASPSPVADIQPQKRRRQDSDLKDSDSDSDSYSDSDSDLKETLNQQGKMLNTFMLRSEEHRSSITKLINHIEAGSSSEVRGNIKHAKIEELQQYLLKQEEDQSRRVIELQDQHKEELKEMQQHHRVEMKEMQQHRRVEMKEMQRHHREEIKEIKQEHGEEIKDLQDQLKNYQERVIQIQEQRNQQILQLLAHRQGD